MIKILPLTGIREVAPGDDLPEILAEALTGTGIGLEAGDILVVTQKIVSKAEGRFVTLSHVKTSQEAERLAAITYKDPRLRSEEQKSELQSLMRNSYAILCMKKTTK